MRVNPNPPMGVNPREMKRARGSEGLPATPSTSVVRYRRGGERIHGGGVNPRGYRPPARLLRFRVNPSIVCVCASVRAVFLCSCEGQPAVPSSRSTRPCGGLTLTPPAWSLAYILVE